MTRSQPQEASVVTGNCAVSRLISFLLRKSMNNFWCYTQIYYETKPTKKRDIQTEKRPSAIVKWTKRKMEDRKPTTKKKKKKFSALQTTKKDEIIEKWGLSPSLFFFLFLFYDYFGFECGWRWREPEERLNSSLYLQSFLIPRAIIGSDKKETKIQMNRQSPRMW